MLNFAKRMAENIGININDKFNKLELLLGKLRETFRVTWNEDVVLYTIRHSKPNEIQDLLKGKEMLLKQENRETIQIVVKE